MNWCWGLDDDAETAADEDVEDVDGKMNLVVGFIFVG